MVARVYTYFQNEDVLDAFEKLIVLTSPNGMMSFLHTVIGPYLSKRAGERFASEGDDVTGPWAPLKEATIRIRETEGFAAGPINRRTGELENWVVQGGWNAYPTGFGASMRYPGREPSGELRRKVETAQKGRVYPSTEPRPVLGVNEADLLFTLTALGTAFEEAVR